METNVENVFNSYAVEYREPLLQIRKLIYETASKIPEVGELQESLKWGQPAYSPIKTSLVSNFRTLFQNRLVFSDNRAIVLDTKIELPIDELFLCIEMATTYHLKKESFL